MSLFGIPGAPAGGAQGCHRLHQTLEDFPSACGNLSYRFLRNSIFIHGQASPTCSSESEHSPYAPES